MSTTDSIKIQMMPLHFLPLCKNKAIHFIYIKPMSHQESSQPTFTLAVALNAGLLPLLADTCHFQTELNYCTKTHILLCPSLTFEGV